MGAGTAEAGVGSGAAKGAAAGTAIVPGWGTAIGAAAGGTMSLIEAGKQGAAKREAERAGEQAVARAKQEQEINFLGAVQVPVEAYNQALRETTANQMQALSALTEAGPRELVGGVGKINAVANQQANDVTNQLADRLYNLNIAQANEQGQTADAMAKLYLGQAEGAQKAAMAANMAQTGLKQGALNAFGTAGAGIFNALSPVYGKEGQDVNSQVSKMQSVMIPEPQAPKLENTQLQGLASPEYQKILEYMTNNIVNLR
jgi:hypothetical protein